MVSFSARSFFSPSFSTNPEKPISQKSPPKNLNCIFHPNPPRFATTRTRATVSQKVQSLDLEFKSLPDPIDRVKRLLYYATTLPPFDESLRTRENRVLGCTAQVWLEVGMDGDGAMSFGVDSDSEITKGFCSCLIWALDGAQAHEVLGLKTDDLLEMNVGLASRVSSRFNAWHNVLISMQRRTKALVEEDNKNKCLDLEHKNVHLLVVSNSVNGVGCKETHEGRVSIF